MIYYLLFTIIIVIIQLICEALLKDLLSINEAVSYNL